jgi:SPP1 gp7 family putative phage head morphogenesis protein
VAFTATANPERFEEAISWWRKRFPVTKELAATLGTYAGDRAWTIAGVAQLDIVLFTFDSLTRAIEKGTPLEQWQEEVSEKLTEAWGKEDSARTETIYRNATQSSYNAGRHRQQHDPDMLLLRPYGRFNAIDDGRTSPICRACKGTVLPLDDPWWDTHTPQLHHRCRSKVDSLSEREVKRLGGITGKPPETDAQKGFGKPPTDAKFTPDKAKYPAPLWSEYQRKSKQLKKLPRKKIKPSK